MYLSSGKACLILYILLTGMLHQVYFILSKYWFVELQILHDICILEKWYWTSLRVQYHFSRMQISCSSCSSQQTNIRFIITCLIYNTIHNWQQNIHLCMHTLASFCWLLVECCMFILTPGIHYFITNHHIDNNQFLSFCRSY